MAQAGGVKARLQQGHLPRLTTIPTELLTMVQAAAFMLAYQLGALGVANPRVGPPSLEKRIC